MKPIAAVLVLALLLTVFVVPQADAQMSFLFGLGAGMLLGSGGNETIMGGAGAAIIYIAPRVSERVNPLSVKFGSVYVKPSEINNVGITLHTMFASIEAKPESYEILQVVRVFDGQYPYNAAFWFAYVLKSDVVPLEKLPPIKK